MKRIAVIVGVTVVLVLGLFAFAHRSGVAFAHPAGMKMMGMKGHAGVPGMGADGCPMAAGATLTPEQQQERAKASAEHHSKHFLPGDTLEKQPAGK